MGRPPLSLQLHLTVIFIFYVNYIFGSQQLILYRDEPNTGQIVLCVSCITCPHWQARAARRPADRGRSRGDKLKTPLQLYRITSAICTVLCAGPAGPRSADAARSLAAAVPKAWLPERHPNPWPWPTPDGERWANAEPECGWV